MFSITAILVSVICLAVGFVVGVRIGAEALVIGLQKKLKEPSEDGPTAQQIAQDLLVKLSRNPVPPQLRTPLRIKVPSQITLPPLAPRKLSRQNALAPYSPPHAPSTPLHEKAFEFPGDAQTPANTPVYTPQ